MKRVQVPGKRRLSSVHMLLSCSGFRKLVFPHCQEVLPGKALIQGCRDCFGMTLEKGNKFQTFVKQGKEVKGMRRGGEANQL